MPQLGLRAERAFYAANTILCFELCRILSLSCSLAKRKREFRAIQLSATLDYSRWPWIIPRSYTVTGCCPATVAHKYNAEKAFLFLFSDLFCSLMSHIRLTGEWKYVVESSSKLLWLRIYKKHWEGRYNTFND